MKKSRVVTLAVLGTAFMAGCTYDPAEILQNEHRDAELKQDNYSSKEDCEKDWGNTPDDCKPKTSGAGYTGPHYFWSHYNGRPYVVEPGGNLRAAPNSYLSNGVASKANSSSTIRAGVSRSGFGSSAHGFSAGG